MDIKDLDFKELLQKPVSTRYLEGQLSSQELETVVGGGARKVPPRVSEPAILFKEKAVPGVVLKSHKFGVAGVDGVDGGVWEVCVPDPTDHQNCICYSQSLDKS